MELLDSPLATAEFLVVDTETNGWAGERCEVTEIGAVLVAEGVESVGELRALRALGIPAAQGYRLGRPGPISDLRAEYGDTFGDVLT